MLRCNDANERDSLNLFQYRFVLIACLHIKVDAWAYIKRASSFSALQTRVKQELCLFVLPMHLFCVCNKYTK